MASALHVEIVVDTRTLDDVAIADGAWIGHGAVAGIIGGAWFLGVQIVVAALTMGLAWSLFPLRMIAGIMLGAGAIDPGSPIAIVAAAGTLAHFTLAAAFGVFFASIVTRRPERAGATMLGMALTFGVGLWLVNYYGIAPWAGWPWFAERTRPAAQLLAHVCYAAPLAVYLHAVESRTRRAAAVEEPIAPSTRRRAA